MSQSLTLPVCMPQKALVDLNFYNVDEETLGCFLYKQSRFYAKSQNSPHAWQVRWVTIDENGFRAYRDQSAEENFRVFNVFQATNITVTDLNRNIIKLQAPSGRAASAGVTRLLTKYGFSFVSLGDVVFQAPNSTVCSLVMERLGALLETYQALDDDTRAQRYKEAVHSRGSLVGRDSEAVSAPDRTLSPKKVGFNEEEPHKKSSFDADAAREMTIVEMDNEDEEHAEVSIPRLAPASI